MIYIRRLIWDDWNVEHIARHQVTPEEVEEVCQRDYIVRESYAGRVMIIGLTLSDRMLSLVLSPEGVEDEYYVVTARSASRRERRLYREERG